ncbi:hypothetical protein FH972_022820 [Carpinus fangiana]|uniref:Inhibitor of growth protein N-terminal histone-binding domain-containing protein n=1 Tax=Carpinus fangiana TaxID=176857 RepID=A0A5N6KTN4_9ROSI|nr:hypothetical protein FH972_022820 [Carpinus fangiana]
MADALSELSGHGPSDPDAQATITDFHDYTEFFPSDLARSLTLIAKLDEEYHNNAEHIHALAKTYGALPLVPAAERADPQLLRKDISHTLDHALRARTATLAEATRLCNVADTLYHRLAGIKKKLSAMPKPPSQESSPAVSKLRSPQTSRTRKVEAAKPKLTLNPPSTLADKNATAAAKEKKRSRRIIVPGEVLPPFDPNSPFPSDVSSSEDDLPPPSPIKPPVFRASDGMLKTPKIQKPPRTPKVRPPGVMGTNVHSTVAGISVSNAMASLTPPPPDALPGSEWQPWLTLTEWELNLLRRRMKKNANWKPSDTMTRRELKDRNRGPEAFARAKAEAEARGEAVLNEPAHKFSNRADEMAPVDPSILSHGDDLLNVGMKLNEQKKLKRRNEEAGNEEDYMAAITAAGQNVAAIYQKNVLSFNGSPVSGHSPDNAKARPGRKRKRDRASNAAADDADVEAESSASPKKLKLVSSALEESPDPITMTTTTQVPLAPEGPSTPGATSHLDVDGATAASSRPSRTLRVPTPAPKFEEEDEPSGLRARHMHPHTDEPAANAYCGVDVAVGAVGVNCRLPISHQPFTGRQKSCTRTMKLASTATRAAARSSHQAHHSGLRPLNMAAGFLMKAKVPAPVVPCTMLDVISCGFALRCTLVYSDWLSSPRCFRRALGVQQVEQHECYDAEKTARAARRGNAGACKVAAHDEAEDAACEIHNEESDGAYGTFHVWAKHELQEKIGANVNDATMHEYGGDEAPPLIRHGLIVQRATHSWVGNAAHAAELGEGTCGARVGCVRTRPHHWVRIVLNAFLVPHARHISCAHVDQHVRRGADHWIERWLRLNGRPSEVGILDQFDDEDDNLYETQDVDQPGYLLLEDLVKTARLLLSLRGHVHGLLLSLEVVRVWWIREAGALRP